MDYRDFRRITEEEVVLLGSSDDQKVMESKLRNRELGKEQGV